MHHHTPSRARRLRASVDPLALWQDPQSCLTTRQPFGERVYLWCRAGTTATDFTSAGPLLTAVCWARDVRVDSNQRYAQLITLDVIRHVPPARPGEPELGRRISDVPAPRRHPEDTNGQRPQPTPPSRRDVGPAVLPAETCEGASVTAFPHLVCARCTTGKEQSWRRQHQQGNGSPGSAAVAEFAAGLDAIVFGVIPAENVDIWAATAGTPLPDGSGRTPRSYPASAEHSLHDPSYKLEVSEAVTSATHPGTDVMYSSDQEGGCASYTAVDDGRQCGARQAAYDLILGTGLTAAFSRPDTATSKAGSTRPT